MHAVMQPSGASEGEARGQPKPLFALLKDTVVKLAPHATLSLCPPGSRISYFPTDSLFVIERQGDLIGFRSLRYRRLANRLPPVERRPCVFRLLVPLSHFHPSPWTCPAARGVSSFRPSERPTPRTR
jgi:hypothetical protein